MFFFSFAIKRAYLIGYEIVINQIHFVIILTIKSTLPIIVYLSQIDIVSNLKS